MKVPCVYILTSKACGTFYIGVTSNLATRMEQHTQGLFDGFTKRYGIKTLVYYEMHETMDTVIAREMLLKRWRREWKYRIIEQMNPTWQNLFDPSNGESAFGPTDAFRLHNEPSRDGWADPRLRRDDGEG